MCFGFQRDDTLHLLDGEEVAGCLVGRSKLLHDWSLCESHVVFICGQYLVRVLLRRFLNHGEERRFHFFSVDDECSSEYFVAAVLGVDLCKAEHLRVGQLSAQLLFYRVEIFDFFR